MECHIGCKGPHNRIRNPYTQNYAQRNEIKGSFDRIIQHLGQTTRYSNISNIDKHTQQTWRRLFHGSLLSGAIWKVLLLDSPIKSSRLSALTSWLKKTPTEGKYMPTYPLSYHF